MKFITQLVNGKKNDAEISVTGWKERIKLTLKNDTFESKNLTKVVMGSV